MGCAVTDKGVRVGSVVGSAAKSYVSWGVGLGAAGLSLPSTHGSSAPSLSRSVGITVGVGVAA